MSLDRVFDELRELPPKTFLAESLGIRSTCFRRDCVALERSHRLSDRVGRLLGKEHAGAHRSFAVGDHRLRHAAAPERDHRRSARLRLDRRDPKILFRRKHERAGSAQQLAQSLSVDVTEKLDVRSRRRRRIFCASGPSPTMSSLRSGSSLNARAMMSIRL